MKKLYFFPRIMFTEARASWWKAVGFAKIVASYWS